MNWPLEDLQWFYADLVDMVEEWRGAEQARTVAMVFGGGK